MLRRRHLVIVAGIVVVAIMTEKTTCIDAWTFPTFSTSGKVYRYFGYGSNLLPSTMKALRQIEPINATAAVLPGFELKFYGMSGRGGEVGNGSSIGGVGGGRWPQLAESSAAFVEPVKDPSPTSSTVHGVLYTLTANDFARVGQTEGVPWGYRWQTCRVYPYVGDGDQAGRTQLESNDIQPVEAYVLGVPGATTSKMAESPPSASYLGLIREGARLWEMDRNYQDILQAVPIATNLLISDGLSGLLLEAAERLTGTDRDYGIPHKSRGRNK